jgi:hypothetical protein
MVFKEWIIDWIIARCRSMQFDACVVVQPDGGRVFSFSEDAMKMKRAVGRTGFTISNRHD